jgi:predicted tellurium resistance membrane protein TerC
MDLITIFTAPQNIIALVTLTFLEIVLGIDNVIFISILADKLPEDQRVKARNLGLTLAMLIRILLLFSLSWLVGLTASLGHIGEFEITGRGLILMLGGLFLIYKSTTEIHEKLEGHEGHKSAQVAASFSSVLIQILLLDIVFSLDSVLTAVGMADEIAVMVVAVVLAVGVMLLAASSISSFVSRHPTVKMLALSFLLMIGLTLIAEGLEFHIPKGYVYFAMGFSIFVEILNLRMKTDKRGPVHLRQPFTDEAADDRMLFESDPPISDGSAGQP